MAQLKERGGIQEDSIVDISTQIDQNTDIVTGYESENNIIKIIVPSTRPNGPVNGKPHRMLSERGFEYVETRDPPILREVVTDECEAGYKFVVYQR